MTADLVAALPEDVSLDDFFAYMPQHQYLFVPTRDLWPATSVNGRLPSVTLPDGKKQKPSAWLDEHRPIEQMTWQPGKPNIVKDRVVQVSGWVRHNGVCVFNLYRPPNVIAGDPTKATPWLEHLRAVYPADADHIELWLAHRIQFPGEKINHALVLGGAQGIGKDTILEPAKSGVGPWNWQDISPTQMLGRFNAWAKAVNLRISEASDLGDSDRFKFYEASKVFMASPPDVLRIDEKNLREHYIANVLGIIITTNHKTDGVYLPADDRRHYVAWSEADRNQFSADYWNHLYAWYAAGGIEHVVAHLAALDLSGFDSKAPPPKTQAFWAMVQAGESPEGGELRDIVERLGSPAALKLGDLIETARNMQMLDFANELAERKNRRSIPHKLERAGYVPVRNVDAPKDSYFVISGRRQPIYARSDLPPAEQMRAVRDLVRIG